MKKFTAILLATLMLIGCLSVMAVSAAETATITVNGKAYNVDVGKTVTYTINLKTVNPIVNFQFYLSYPQSILAIESNDDVEFPLVDKSSVSYNYNENITNEFRANYSNSSSSIDFTGGADLVRIKFKVTAAGTGSIGLINETKEATAPGEITRETVISSCDSTYVMHDEVKDAVITENFTGYNETSVIVTAGANSIFVNESTNVVAIVENGEGKTTFKSSSSKIATVSATGKVTGKSEGKVTITATNNGVSGKITITVAKRSQKMTVKASSKNLKYSAVKKKAQTFKAITVKNSQGKVTYAKTSGNAKISVNKTTGKITVKKGTKKATYAVKVKVTAAGNAAYKKATKTTTVKIKIK